MSCMNCGAAVIPGAEYCSKCGWNIQVQKKAVAMSKVYYNKGLEKATIRDLSGAISCLKQSLKLNKMNIPARNLLGLVYFEVGEVVAALSEWVISKNLMPSNNLASEYIEKLQANPSKLDTINLSIRKYNQALSHCKEGHDDIAMVQLKKVLSQNPKLIKGYHLLALIQIKNEAYAKARRTLRKTIKIDKTNTTTLRFLKEIDERTGVTTNVEQPGKEKKEKHKKGKVYEDSAENSNVYLSGNDVIIQPPTFRESSMAAMAVYIGVGFLAAMAALWFLILPAMTQKINAQANKKVVEYSDTIAVQDVKIQQLEDQVKALETMVDGTVDQNVQQSDPNADPNAQDGQDSGAQGMEDTSSEENIENQESYE